MIPAPTPPPQLSFDHTHLTPQGEKLLAELEALLAHPRGEAILLSDWLHDGSLPVPGPELIGYIGFRLLSGSGVAAEVAALDRLETARRVMRIFREESAAQRRASIERCRLHIEGVKMLHSGKPGARPAFTTEWLPVLSSFLHPAGDEPCQTHGLRVLARGMLEAALLRAVFHFDVQRVEALAAALQMIRNGEAPAPSHARRIAGEVARFAPWLQAALGRLPTKEELKTFLREVFPDEMPERDEPYVTAYQLIAYHGPEGHRKKMDRMLIIRLALQARRMAGTA